MQTHVLDPVFESLRREFDSGCRQAETRANAAQLQTLNQLFRRFRAYQTEAEWIQITVEAASNYADFVALFSIAGDDAQLRGQAPDGALPEDLVFPLSSAAAFSSAIESKDPVTALRSATEVSAILSTDHVTERAHIFPITNGERVSALLFASGASCEMNALELITGIASSVLERKANAALHAQIAAAPPAAATETKLPAWSDLPVDQRQLHIRAQRFARVTIAELQLARPEACRAGREQGDLYLFLKREIDRARESYQKQFMKVPSMVDYLHLELIQTAAQGNEQKLGADYPGRLL